MYLYSPFTNYQWVHLTHSYVHHLIKHDKKIRISSMTQKQITQLIKENY